MWQGAAAMTDRLLTARQVADLLGLRSPETILKAPLCRKPQESG
jgi:hypothetical protein